MKIPIKQDLYLSQPAQVLTLNFDNADEVFAAAHCYKPDYEWIPKDWLRIGRLEGHIIIDTSQAQLAEGAVKAILTKMAELENNHRNAMAALQAGLNKLQALGFSGKVD